MRSRQGLAITVLGCAVASALVIFAASRVWSEELPSGLLPLPPVTTGRTGSSFAPWLSPLGVVGLASAGALLATRGLARRAIGVLMAVVGAAVMIAALLPLGSGPRPLWPVVAAVAGAVVVAAGVATVWAGGAWPAMGARYELPGRAREERPGRAGDERPGRARDERPGNAGDERPGRAGDERPAEPKSATQAEMWDALDRGEDPTG